MKLPSSISSAIERDSELLTWVAEHLVPLNWAEVLESTATEPDWLVESMFICGNSYAVVASAKVGKSLLMLDLSCALATGSSALGQTAREPVTVLYIDMENTEADLADRVRDLGYSPHELQSRLHYLSFPGLAALDTEEGGRQVHAAARFFGADLVVIDTLSRVVEGDENDAHTYQAFYRHAVTPLKRDGTTVVRLDHLGKDTSRGARGSSAKSDDVDAVWLLDSLVGSRLQLKLERQRSRHHPESLVVHRKTEPLRHVVAGAASTEVPGGVHDALAALGADESPVTVRQLVEALHPEVVGDPQAFDKARARVHRKVDGLVSEGRVAKQDPPGGGTQKVLRLVPEGVEA